MCNQLNALEWSKVGVGFSGVSSLMPLAHNKLAALQREGWRKVFESIEGAADGEPIMQHAAEYILSDRDGPRPWGGGRLRGTRHAARPRRETPRV